MQIRLAIAAVLFCAWSALALFLGHQWGRVDGAAREASLLSKQMDAVLAGAAEDRKEAAKRQKLLDRLIKSEGKVREIIRDNPSGCRLTDPVHDGLREAIRAGNAPRKVSDPA